jgi:hypothetical protein
MLYFLVKWEGKSYNECTWEAEYFLKDQYEQVLHYCAQKSVIESASGKSKAVSAASLFEDVITAKRLLAKGLEALIPENSRRNTLAAAEEELKQNRSFCLQSSVGYETTVLLFLQKYILKHDSKRPSLIVCDKLDVERWRSVLHLFFPQIQYAYMDFSVVKNDLFWRTEINEALIELENVELMITDFDTMKQVFLRIHHIPWEWIVMDSLTPSDSSFKVLDLFNKPFYRTNSKRISCIPPLTVQSVGKAVINQTISLHIALRRFINSPTLNSALLAQGLFPTANDKTVDFYLSTTQASSLLASVPSSELASLETRLERPLYFSSLPVISKVVLRTIILRLSDLCKAEYAAVLTSNSRWLADCEQNKKFAENSKMQIAALCSAVSLIDNRINPKIVEDDARTLEIDSKLRWILKYLEALKLNGQTERVVLVYVSEAAQLRSFQVLQRFTKYCIWQINDNVDTAEVNIRISEFSRVEHKITVLTVNYKNMWKLRGVRSGLVIVMGHTGEPYQTEVKVNLLNNLENFGNGR